MNFNDSKSKIIAIVAGVIVVIVAIVLALMFIGGRNDSNTPPDQSNASGPSSSTAEPDDPYQLYDIEIPAQGPPINGEPVDNQILDMSGYEPDGFDDGFEDPGVIHTYTKEVDTDKDARISKDEWQVWVDAHPEDLNKDLIITDEEKAEYAARQKDPDGEHDTDNPAFNPQTQESLQSPSEEELKAAQEASDQESLELINKNKKNREGAGKVDTSKKDEHGNAIITDPDAV